MAASAYRHPLVQENFQRAPHGYPADNKHALGNYIRVGPRSKREPTGAFLHPVDTNQNGMGECQLLGHLRPQGGRSRAAMAELKSFQTPLQLRCLPFDALALSIQPECARKGSPARQPFPHFSQSRLNPSCAYWLGVQKLIEDGSSTVAGRCDECLWPSDLLRRDGLGNGLTGVG